jgi:predicted dehydrogenase
MTKKLKVGLIGTGLISRLHAPGWQASTHAELVAASDIDTDKLQIWGKTHGVTRLAIDPATLLNDPEIDIIDICTPNRQHTSLVIAALEAGKHVICEKPLAPTPQEIRQMIEARDRSGKLLMTAQHFRFTRISQAMKAEIATGVLGDVYHARSWMLRRNNFVCSPTFILKEYSGGGPCIDIGVHILDLTLWLMGNPNPVAVTGVARAELAHQEGAFSAWRNLDVPVPPEFDVEDFSAAFVRFDNGATLILEVSWLLHHNIEGEDMQAWLYGAQGGCHWPKGEFLQTNNATRQFYNYTLQRGKDIMEPHAMECVEFAKAVAEELPSPVPPEQSLQVMTILAGIYRSQESGREVQLEL